MLGYKSLDAGLNISWFRGDIAFPINKIGGGLSRLVYATTSQVIKPLDKTSFQFYNLFRTMKTCAMNAESSIIVKLPKSIASCLEMGKQNLSMFSVHIEIAGALNLEQKKLWWKDNGKNNWKRRYLAFWDRSYNNHYCYYYCLSPRISIV